MALWNERPMPCPHLGFAAHNLHCSNLQSDLYLAYNSEEYADMVSEINKQCKSSM